MISPGYVEPPKFYHFAAASGLVKPELMDEILKDFEVSGTAALETLPNNPVVRPVDRRHLQHPARLRGSAKSALGRPKEDDLSTDGVEASLDGSTPLQDRATDRDRYLAGELVRRGILNHWQSTQLLDGRTKFSLGGFWVLDALGKGGYGHVFLGREDRKRREERHRDEPVYVPVEQFVALKVLPLSKATPELTTRFLHEIDVQKGLAHPNLIRFLDSGRDGNVHFMVHEFADGGDLRVLLNREGRLPIEVAAPVTARIARGLHYLHENGIVHRDVKPANVLLSSDGTPKLTDMGLAVVYHRDAVLSRAVSPEESGILESRIDSAMLSTGKVAGTVDYMAPDQIREPGMPWPSWDIYSLGCMLYQILTGSVPFPQGDAKQKFRARLQFDPPDPRLHNQAIPYDLVDLLRAMLAREPENRIRTAGEVADRLDAWTPPSGLLDRLTFDEDESITDGLPLMSFH